MQLGMSEALLKCIQHGAHSIVAICFFISMLVRYLGEASMIVLINRFIFEKLKPRLGKEGREERS